MQAANSQGGVKVAAGQRAFTHRAEMNYLAAKGDWTKAREQAA
ncbi:hypothetical protein [Rhizobium sp. NPDC090279]